VFDPEVLKEGIPDGAYKPLTGDEKPVCTSLKKANQAFAKRGQRDLFSFAAGTVAVPSQAALDAVAEDNLAGVAAKAQAHREWLQQPAVQQQLLAANVYTAAFFLPKTSATQAVVPTSEHLDAALQGGSIPPAMAAAVTKAADDFRFLHWHLAFPDVMQAGGFDCLLGNPPWERIKLQEKEFFAARSEAIATAPNKAARERLIQALSAADASEADQALVREFELAKREAEGSGEFIRGSGRFALTAVGDLNTYALFAEHFLKLIGPDGRAGLIIPSGIATDFSCKDYFKHLVDKKALISLLGFDNARKIFPSVHPDTPFSLVTLGYNTCTTDIVHYALAVGDLTDSRRHFSIDANDLSFINPNTHTCPSFRSQMDALVTQKIHRSAPVLCDNLKKSEWGFDYMTKMFDMANDSGKFMKYDELSGAAAIIDGKTFDLNGTHYWPLYEAKYINIYNHLWNMPRADHEQKQNISRRSTIVQTRYWIRKDLVLDRIASKNWDRSWVIGWRDITNATNERTLIASMIPLSGIGHTIRIAFFSMDTPRSIFALGALSSLVLDFVARQKVGGTHLTVSTLSQIPFIPPSGISDSDLEFIVPRVSSLAISSELLEDTRAEIQEYGYKLFAYQPVDVSKAELDAYYAHLYGLTRDELRYILDPADLMGPDYPSETFRVLKNNEVRQFGEYRTQRLVLEAWDRLFGE
jgi:hypothetical protein